MSKVEAISVTQLARRVRNLLEIQVGQVWVEGEVSNLRKQGSGHWYFSLKDESSQISCAMFGARKRAGHEVMKDGAKVQLFGEVSFYEARGSTQLIVQKARALGVGDLQARFQALKEKLDQEGLFATERKRSLPYFPRVIGVVTSPSGAALQDMKNVLLRRAPWLKVVLFPASVQGKGAERGIVRAIERANEAGKEGLPQPEVLIVGRGGGSIEDLWNFNEEVVARAIAASVIPVISAVGHEIDFTIADFVADLRAPTPSAAAELVAPDGEELRARLSGQESRQRRAVHGRLERLSDKLDYLERSVFGQSAQRLLQGPEFRLEQVRDVLKRVTFEKLREKEERVRELGRVLASRHPRELYRRRGELLETQKEQFLRAGKRSLEGMQRGLDRQELVLTGGHPRKMERRQEEELRAREKRFLRAAKQGLENLEGELNQRGLVLEALGPKAVLERGFSITMGEDGEVVRNPSELEKGDLVRTRLAGGEFQSEVL